MIQLALQSSLEFFKQHGRLLLIGTLLMFFSTFGQTVFIGAHIPFLREHFGLSHSKISTFYAIATLSSAFLLFWSGKLIDHIKLVKLIPLILCGLATGAFIIAFTPHPIFLIVAFFLLRQCGQGLMTTTSSVSINRYLDKNRGRATAIVNLGSTGHMMTMPLLAMLVVATIGWQQAWMGYGLFILFILIPIFYFLSHNHEKTTHARWEEKLKNKTEEEKDTSKQWTRREVLKDWRFYMIASVIVIAPCFNTAVFFYQGELASATGISSAAFTSTFVNFTVGAIVASFVAGTIIDHYGEKFVLLTFPILYAAGLLVMIYADSYLDITISMTMVGLADGSMAVLGGPLLAKLYGTQHLGAVKSTLSSTNILSTGVSPPLVGIFLDLGFKIGGIFMGFVVYACLAWFILVIFLRKQLT